MEGAILIQFTQLSIDTKEDKGVLFYTVNVTFVLSGIILYSQRKKTPIISNTISF